MTCIEPVNYKYLGIAIVFLLFTYFYLEKTKKHINRKTMKTSYRSSIKVLTKKGEIYMDPNIFEMHMNRLKNNIIILHKKIDMSNCSDLTKYLNDAKAKTNSYIKMNIKSINNSFCDDNVLIEIELLKKKMVNKTETDNDDDDTSDKIRYKLLELITDIDIILFLSRESLCKNGFVDLSCLDQVIRELYRIYCSGYDDTGESSESFKTSGGGICGLNTPTPCYGGVDNYHDSLINIHLGLTPESISRSVPTQDNTDTSAMPMKETCERKPVNNNATVQSHGKEIPFECNTVRLGKQLDISDYGRESLEWYRNYDLIGKSGSILDTDCRSCMRDDYKHLEDII